MKKVYEIYGDVIIEVLVSISVIGLITLFFASNGTIQTLFSDMFTKLASYT